MSHKLSPSVSSGGSPLSAVGGSGGGSVLAALTAAPAEVAAAAEIIEKMKGSLGSFGKTLDSLGEQTVQMIQVGGQAEITNHINSIRCHMDKADERQQEQVRGIEELLWKVLEQDVIEHLTALIQDGILEEIDAIVQEEVARQCPAFIPQNLQDELRASQRELEKVQRALHDSESRRANSTLRSHRLHEKVHPLHNSTGEISNRFPLTLGDMFGIPAETAKALLEEYGLEVSESREKNINTFMCHCGVQYQLIPTEGGPTPCRIHASAS
ncbi:hypothetical protein GSI_04972 [Ganoderma sinense ZZ0214-1]|uniref:Uncharacterized protein n=1 Tax=Ganoderma sinense ZZ0214-1 TaxID=1077348 RepID=A0A2G8SGE8_9APHY|nr:hypothetical protein GSI_04972 [Ganoderma sinense ZZ0214-1]